MSPKLSPAVPDVDRHVVRSTILSCIVGVMALAVAALAFTSLEPQAATTTAAPAPSALVSEPISSVPSAAEVFSNVPWKPEPEVVTSGG